MRLRLENLTKVYRGNVVGIKGVSLEVKTGMFGLLGPNGAGKTTLMRILATLLEPTAGRAFVGDFDVRRDGQAIRSVLGYLPQEFGVYPELNAREFLDYIAGLKGLRGVARRREVGEALERVGLAEVACRRLRTYSSGMRQRLGVAQALLGEPQLLIVDEPTAGLDPAERVRFRNLLAELSGRRTVVLSTHIVADVAHVCADIAILRRGQVLARGTPQQFLERVRGRVWQVTVSERELESIQRRHRVIAAAYTARGVQARVVADRVSGAEAQSVEPTLEDAYMDMVGGGER